MPFDVPPADAQVKLLGNVGPFAVKNGCVTWSESLIDISFLYSNPQNLHVRCSISRVYDNCVLAAAAETSAHGLGAAPPAFAPCSIITDACVTIDRRTKNKAVRHEACDQRGGVGTK